jgi:hypothetical protein
MNTAIETELKNLLDNVNKRLALKMSEKHGLDYDEVYEFLTTSMNEDKAPASRGRPKKEKKTITENQKDTTGKPDVNHIIKEIMEKDAELEELTEDEIDEDVVEVAKEASPASPLPNDDKSKEDNDKSKEDNDKSKEDDKKPKEKAKRKPAASAEEKAKAAEEKKAEAEKLKAQKAEEKKAEAEKLKAQKAAEKEAAKAEKKPRGKSGKKKEEKVEVVAEVKEAAEAAASSSQKEDEEGENASEIEFNGKIYLKQEFGSTIFDAVTHEEIGEWDEKNQKIIFNV